MPSQVFKVRMAELDAIVAQCLSREPFVSGVVSDASNRSGRDWPWWGVQVAQTQVDGSQSRRATAIITLRSNQAGEPDSFDVEWRAQVWIGVGADTFRQEQRQELEWEAPTPRLVQETIAALLNRAKSAIPSWTWT